MQYEADEKKEVEKTSLFFLIKICNFNSQYSIEEKTGRKDKVDNSALMQLDMFYATSVKIIVNPLFQF